MLGILNLAEQRWILFLDSQWIFPSFLVLEDTHSEKSVLTVSTKHVKMIFFVLLSSHSVCYGQIHILTHLEFICCPEPDFQLCWKTTLAAINTLCLNQHLSTVSTRPGSPGLSYYSKAKNMYPVPEVEHRRQAAAASISWKLSSWFFPDLILMPPVKAKQKA